MAKYSGLAFNFWRPDFARLSEQLDLRAQDRSE